MEVHMQLMHEVSENARITIYANRDENGIKTFTLDSYVYREEDNGDRRAHPLNINRYIGLRAVMADADRVLAGLITESHQLMGEAKGGSYVELH